MKTAAIAVLLTAAFVLGQWLLGAHASDLGGDPDEAAHAVTALMVRDYLWEGVGESPMGFARRYYEAFPKVALGHYPPGYYVTAAAALSLWCDPRMLLVFQAVLAVGLGMLTRWVLIRFGAVDSRAAWLAALLVIGHTEVVRLGSQVMSDLQLAVLVLGAAAAWVAYLREPGWRWSLIFGGLAAGAILTKGSAMGLAGVPMLAVVFTRRWKLLRRLDFWGCGVPVVLVAGPWMLYSVGFTEEGFVGETPWGFFVKAVAYHAEAIPRVYGWVLVALTGVALGRLIWDWAMNRGVDELRAALWAGLLSMQALVMVVPSGFSPRYLLPGLALVVVLAVVELGWLVRSRLWVGVLLLWVTTEASTWRHRPKRVEGFGAAVRERIGTVGGEGVWLVASDPRGEGAVIAAAAFASEDRVSGRLKVLRGSKVVADTDWLGKSYKEKFKTHGELLAELDRLEVEWLLVDESIPLSSRRAHEAFLKAALEQAGETWKPGVPHPVHRETGKSGVMGLFERKADRPVP